MCELVFQATWILRAMLLLDLLDDGMEVLDFSWPLQGNIYYIYSVRLFLSSGYGIKKMLS